jgi:nucleotide-binding universal stress UspA family protein
MTENITRILVPVDFSGHSDRALSYATALAGRMGATLLFLHVVDDPVATGAWSAEVYIPNVRELRELQVAHATPRLDALRAAAGAGGVAAEATVLTGQPARTIVEHAREGGCDLVVMATQGRTGLSHLLMGSVAEYVVRHAHCPVLTMRADADIGTATAGAAA